MPDVRFKKICLDAAVPTVVGPFWGEVLGLRWAPDPKGEGGLFGADGRCTIWVNRVATVNPVKRRVHLDMYATSLQPLLDLGSHVLLPEGDDRRWTVLADLEGGEYCAFIRPDPPAETLHGLVIDCADPPALARWWAERYGGTVTDFDAGYSAVTDVAGVTYTMDFVPVPEGKSGPNSIHWDVAGDAAKLTAAGATLLRSPGDDVSWHVMADPAGNEFCVFSD
jgi:Glyoxalase-like domain